MTPDLQKRIDQLNRSAMNYANATNRVQREAAQKFLVRRAMDMKRDMDGIGVWLEEADAFVNAHMPQINTDPNHQHNIEWLEQLGDYQAMQDAITSAWNVMAEDAAA